MNGKTKLKNDYSNNIQRYAPITDYVVIINYIIKSKIFNSVLLKINLNYFN